MKIWPELPPEIERLSDAEFGERLIQCAIEFGARKPVVLDRRGVGSGKTQEALDMVRQRVPELDDGEAIYIFAPTTVLCGELQMRLVVSDEGLKDTCLTWRGRSALDPQGGQPMCLYSDAADAVSKRGGDPENVLCKSKGLFCKHYETCGYRAQQVGINEKKIIIMPTAMLSLARREGMGDAHFVIIDEDPCMALLDERITFTIDDVIAPITVKAKPEATKLVSAVLGQLHIVLNDAKGTVPCAGLPDAENIREAITLLHKVMRSSSGRLRPNPTSAAVERYMVSGALAQRASKLIKLLTAIQRSRRRPHVIGCRVRDREVTVLLKKFPNKAYESAPTLILSATADPQLLRNWWSQLDASKLEVPVARHETVIQYRAKATKALLTNGRLMKSIFAAICRLSQEFRNTGGNGPDGLVVMQKAPAEDLKLVAPENMEVANFGALAGVNTFENVGVQLIIGRPMPHPDEVELIAEVIKNDAIDRKGADFFMNWYPKADVPIRLKDGRDVMTKAEWHPDPIANAVLNMVSKGEVIQANRARGLRRTERNPLTTMYINELPAPVPVDDVIEGLPFGPVDVMVGKGLVLDVGAGKGRWQVIAAVVPEWFETKQAARRYFQNAASNVLPKIPSSAQSHISTLYGFGHLRENAASCKTPTPTVPFDDYVHAKVTLATQRYGVPVFIDLIHSDPEEHATKLLGPLKKFEILHAPTVPSSKISPDAINLRAIRHESGEQPHNPVS
jgi:hypothetical protein